MEDPRLKEAEEELERGRLALQHRQQDERNVSQQDQPNGQPDQDMAESIIDSGSTALQ